MNNKKQSNNGKLRALQEQGSVYSSSKKVRDPLFLNEEFFDPNDIVQVKYELLRRVQVEGVSITDAVKNFGFSRLSFYRTLKIFDEFGLPGLIPKKRGPKKAHKMTTEILEFIHNKIQDSPSINNVTLKKMIEEKFNLLVHTRSINRALSPKKKETAK